MKIVCFGDSLTACGGPGGRYSDVLQDRFPDHTFVNRGAGGEAFPEALARLETDVLAERPDLVLVAFGANDWWRDERPPAAWAADLETILARVTAAGARGVVLGVFGDYLDEADRRVPKQYGIDERAVAYRDLERAAAERFDCAYHPNIQERIIGRRTAWADRNHPNEYGNRFVADAIEPLLADRLGTRPRPIRKPTLRTVRDYWDEAVALAPDRTAVVHGDRRLTYAEADVLVERLAAGFARLAGTERPTVAAFLPNGLEYYLAYWAVMRLGGVIAPLNTWLKEESLAGIFGTVRPDLLIVRSGDDAPAVQAAQLHEAKAIVALDPGFADLHHWRMLLRDGPPAPRPAIGDDDLAIVMHTSGTT
ncbi:MAG: AMP-binding protein, partial [Planctomycetota bacterium]